MTQNHGDTETAAREALDDALTWIAAELEHRNEGGRPRMVALTTVELQALTAALSARPSAPDAVAAEWQPIETMPDDDSLVLAGCPADTDFPQGRVMIWKASILARNLKGPTPRILAFPATVWRPLPSPPALRPTTQTTETEANDGNA